MDERDFDIHRPIYNFKKFEKKFEKPIDANEQINHSRHRNKALKALFNLTKIFKLFTIINVVKNYSIKKSLLNDVLSGLIVGVAIIPQALAFGSLTSLPAIHGIYTTLFSSIIFMMFTSSRHLSVGTIGVISVMIYATIDELEGKYIISLNNNNNNINKDNFTIYNTTTTLPPVDLNLNADVKLKIAISLTFWSGITQMIFSMFRIGKISKYLSTGLMRGFTTGVTFHMLGSQLQHILGIYPKRPRTKYFKLFHAFLRLWDNRASFNIAAFIIGTIALLTLVLIRFQINERFHKKMRNIPIPTEFIVVIIGTICTYHMQLDKLYDLKVVGPMPTETKQTLYLYQLLRLKDPVLPDFELFFQILPDAIILTILSFVLSMSIADTFAKKHKYKLNPNKELFALGAANTISSFFNCFACAGSLGATVLLDTSGGSSQIVSLVSGSVLLTFVLWVAPFFEKLPKACLGAIILASLINTFRLLKELKYYWKACKIDFFTWVVTTGTIIILNIEYGLLVGFITLLFLHVSQRRNPKLSILGQIKNTEIYVDVNHFTCNEVENIKIIRFTDSIFYLNATYFKKICYELIPLRSQLNTSTDCDCEACFVLDYCRKNVENRKARKELEHVTKAFDDDNAEDSEWPSMNNTFIILDCSMMTMIDETGLKTIKEVIDDYKLQNLVMYLAHCNDKIIEFMKSMGYYENYFDSIVFLTIHDAVLHAQFKLNKDMISITDGFAYIDALT